VTDQTGDLPSDSLGDEGFPLGAGRINAIEVPGQFEIELLLDFFAVLFSESAPPSKLPGFLANVPPRESVEVAFAGVGLTAWYV
jgi:hypothetical protein